MSRLDEITDEEFDKLSDREQVALINEDLKERGKYAEGFDILGRGNDAMIALGVNAAVQQAEEDQATRRPRPSWGGEKGG
tara:strand:+ start:357 stop:596 length:240 start_codon:yes stop_codon:yes gene_type:complete